MVPAVPADDTRRIALVDLLDRVLGGGVVITDEITLSLADVEMVRISLRNKARRRPHRYR
ncbi:gas vesicle protein [Rhodococcus opacus]|uniref:gas vesicle protein n=1 Tax=Rhodococcus opacus TaxID=37919 RepID=UPI001C9E0E8C|nr:gas vesicle protein [Rhodococcus opacus]QZS59992.1 gas vesicle protein [Rhodococcus opacus]